MSTFMDLQERKRLLLDELNSTQQQIGKVQGIEGAIDIHHPERSAGWPIYRHQSFPKMVYHPIKLDPQIETQRQGVRQRNLANPHLAPQELPASRPLTRIVKHAEELEQAEAEGFVKTPPMLQSDEETAQLNSDPLSNPDLMDAAGMCSRGCGKRPHPGRCVRVPQAV